MSKAGYGWLAALTLLIGIPVGVRAQEAAAPHADTEIGIIEKITKDMGAVARQLQEKQQKLSELQSQYDTLQQTNGEILQQLAKKEQQVQQVNKELDTAHDRIEELNSLAARTKVEMDALAQQKEQALNATAQLEKQRTEAAEVVELRENELRLERAERAAEQQRSLLKIQELQAQLDQKLNDLNARRDDVRLLEESLKQQREKFEAQAAEEKSRLQNVLDEKQRLLNTIKGYESELAKGEKVLQENQQQLMAQKKEFQEQLSAKEQELFAKIRQRDEQLLQDQEKHAKAIGEYKQLLRGKDEQIQQLQEEARKQERLYTDKLSEKEQQMQSELTKLREESQQRLQSIGDNLDLEKQRTAAQLAEYVRQLQKKDEQLDSLRTVVAQRDQVILDMSGKDQQQKLSQEIDVLKRENELLTVKNSRLTEEKLQLMARMVKYVEKGGQQEESRQEDMKYVHTELQGISETVAQVQDKYEKLKKDFELLLQEKIELVGAYEQSRQQVASRDQEVQLLQDKMTRQNKDHVKRLEDNQNDLHKQLKEFRDLAAEMEKKTALFNKDKENYLSQIAELRERCSKLESELKIADNDRQLLSKQVKDFYAAERNWKKKDAEQIQLLSKYSDKIDALTQEVSELMTGNKQLELKIKTLPEQLSRLENESEKLRQQNSTLHYNLGVFHTQRQEYTQAVDEFEQALKFNPNDSNAHYNLGIIFSRYLIQEAKAVAHFKHYLDLAPNDPDAQRAREYILIWGAKEGIR